MAASVAFAECSGASGTVKAVTDGIVQKAPWEFGSEYFVRDVSLGFVIEPKILEYLGPHPRIIGYLGRASNGRGILLQQANHGDLQTCLGEHQDISAELRAKWCRQAAEALAFIHSRGVIHSDVRPANFLIHSTKGASPDLLLCDFGGSVCETLGLDGGSLPSVPFWHPAFGWNSTVALDIFGLGSVIYTIQTGRWPYRDGPRRPSEGAEWHDYEAFAEDKLRREEYPDVSQLRGGDIVLKCWARKYASAQDVLDDLILAGF